MKISTGKFRRLAVASALCAGFAGSVHSAPLDLSGQAYVTYGDANSYALQVTEVITGDSSFDVNSTAGQIKDLIVIATGASGAPVNTNVAGMDDALSTPNGESGSNFFSGIWNSTIAAFTGFLEGLNPLFFFNNNQINSGAGTNQNVAVWAQLSLTGTGVDPIFFDFTNRNSPYALFTEGGGGVLNGSVGDYSSTGAGPIAGTNAATDYVLSGGPICLTALNVPVSCSNPLAVEGPINNNLGAEQAAYAIDVPELNAFLAKWLAGDLSVAGYTDLHVDLRFGCDPATVGTNGGDAEVGDCIGRNANNGYEQLFVGTSIPMQQVPEPGVLWLLGASMLGMALVVRRKV